MLLTTILAIWGAVLSTVLCSIKVYEIYRDRSGVVVRHSFAEQDEIILYNPSSIEILIDYWELVWITKRNLFTTKVIPIHLDGGENFHTILEAHSKKNIDFNDQYQIPWRSKPENSKLYIRLYINGRRKLTKLIL